MYALGAKGVYEGIITTILLLLLQGTQPTVWLACSTPKEQTAECQNQFRVDSRTHLAKETKISLTWVTVTLPSDVPSHM